MLRKLVLIALAALCCVSVKAEESVPEDFVTASILFAEPGGALYSRAGHIAIRMQCPDHNLDFVFSYESENAPKKILKFLSGNLTMGLFAIPVEEYLSPYRDEGRSVTEYEINLPIDVKRNLWRILDRHLKDGIELPYDYLIRGCAQSSLRFLKEGLAPSKIDYGPWPDSFSLTRRELTGLQMKRYPWTWAFLNLIGNGSIDSACSNEMKVIMPVDLLAVLKNASFEGKPLLEQEGKIVVEGKEDLIRGWGFTPLHLSLILLLFAIICAIFRKTWTEIPFLVIQSALGIVSLYLVAFSTLPCTQWSWLLVPFNPLPLIFWKWRDKWSLPFSAVCLIWAIVMLLLRHPVTDTCYAVFALSVAVSSFTTWKYAGHSLSVQP